ncbi:MAG: response regulator [Pseudomonadota bacterium]
MSIEQKEKILKVLLVEDDQDFREALQNRLTKRGFELTIKATAEEALDALNKNDFDAVVSDIKLPSMDGVEFLKRVRSTKDGMPVILLTGYASLESAQEAVRLNAFDYLLKPLENINELTDPLHKAIHTYRLQRENEKLTEELKLKVKELEKARQEYQGLFELANDIIYVTNREGKIIAINNRVKEITTHGPANFISKPMESLFTKTSHKEVKEKFQGILKGNGKELVEVEIISENKDNPVVAELSMRPIEESGQITGAHGILRDITERKNNEEALRLKTNELEQRTVILQRFQDFAVGRELKMVQLKEEINELLKELGRSPKYKSPTQTDPDSTKSIT